MLRSAATVLFSWLEDHYWTPQFEYLCQLGELCAPTIGSSTTDESDKARLNFIANKQSTVASQMLVPLFIDAVISLSDGYSAREHCQRTEASWLATISSAISLNPALANTIIATLLCKAVDVVRVEKSQTQTEHLVYCCCFWVDRIVTIAANAEVFLNELTVLPIVNRYKTSSKHILLTDLFLFVEAAYGLQLAVKYSGGVYRFSDVTVQLVRRSPSIDNGDDKGCWPLGLLPGVLDGDDLCMIEYDQELV
jgi:hypothetical protein